MSTQKAKPMTTNMQEWLPNDTWSGVERTADRKLSGIRIDETYYRRTASRELEKESPRYYGNGNFMVRMRNTMTLHARRIVERIDAVSAWENEGGR